MYKKPFLFFLFGLSVFLVMNCESEVLESTDFNRGRLDSASVFFIDTVILEVQDSELKIVQFKDSIFLGLDESSEEVFLFDLAGNVISRFKKNGEGPYEYGDIKKIGFSKRNEVLILDEKGLKVFDKIGTYVGGCNFSDFQTSWPSHADFTLIPTGIETFIYSSVNNNYSPENKSFFDHTTIGTKVEFSNCKKENFGGFEKGSIYKKSKKYLIPYQWKT